MQENKEVKSVEEIANGNVQMQYSRPKWGHGRNALEREENKLWFKDADPRDYAVYGYKVVPCRVMVNTVSGAAAKMKAPAVPSSQWIELLDGCKPILDVAWCKGINANDDEDDVLKDCDMKHTRKTKGTAYTKYFRSQITMKKAG
jgi:hypothetical protein